MKIYSTLSLLLVVASLVGCNNLATKPDSLSTERGNHAANQPVDVILDEAMSTEVALQRFVKNKELQPTTPVSSQSAEEPATKTRRDKKTSVKLTQNILKTKQVIGELVTPKLNKERPIRKIDNLWQRLRQGYGMPTVDNSRIQRAFEKFVNSPSYFKRITTKAQPYLYHIVEELEKRNMPLEIALLPAIESAYEPLALSSKSAAGLWQFMPATGKDYGLKQDYWYDGRRDIIRSTTAALDYLQYLHQLFGGDWFLALAAYNYGEGNVTKAIAKNKRLDQATDFWSLNLPRETREYVPKLLGLCKVVANPQKYGIQLQKIANKPYLKRLNVGRQIDLSSIAKLTGLSVTELKRLNPAYRRGVTAPKGPHYITLPLNKVGQFQQALAKRPPNSLLVQANYSKPPFQRRTTKTQTHKVRRGENLTMIAKRYGTTLAKLRQLNKLKAGRPLYVGKRLKVPGTKTKTNRKTVLAKLQSHKVRRGENLTMIAKRYGTTVAELRLLNKLNAGRPLYVGKRLKVPGTKTKTKTNRKTVLAKIQSHKVRRGENLTMIAKRYGTTVAELRLLNKLNAGPLHAGKRLKVPGTKTKTVLAKIQRHKVRRGENLTTIAKRYGTTVPLLRQWNKIKGNVVKWGQSLKVPTTVAVLQKSRKKPKNQKIIHRVRAGQTLGGIARHYHVSIKKIKQWNNLRKNSLLKGQRLTILLKR